MTELFNLVILSVLKPVIFSFLHLLILHNRWTKENMVGFFCCCLNLCNVIATAIILGFDILRQCLILLTIQLYFREYSCFSKLHCFVKA